MVPLIVLSTFIGAVLGLRFRVFVLAPATGLTAVVTIAIGLGQSGGWSSLLLVTALAMAALQVGYMIGSVVSLAIARTRLAEGYPRPTAATRNPAR